MICAANAGRVLISSVDTWNKWFQKVNSDLKWGTYGLKGCHTRGDHSLWLDPGIKSLPVKYPLLSKHLVVGNNIWFPPPPLPLRLVPQTINWCEVALNSACVLIVRLAAWNQIEKKNQPGQKPKAIVSAAIYPSCKHYRGNVTTTLPFFCPMCASFCRN